MSGTGKSTALRELALRGFPVVDTDEPGWKELRDGEWVWREDRIVELLAADGERTLYVSGCVSNQGRFYDSFDAVVLLSAPANVILSRIAYPHDERALESLWANGRRSSPTSSRRSPGCAPPAPTRSTRPDRSTTSSRGSSPLACLVDDTGTGETVALPLAPATMWGTRMRGRPARRLGRPSWESRLWVAAILVISFGALLTQAVPGEAASHGSGELQSRRVPLRPAAAGAQITVTLHFTPRHARSLALLASHPGTRPRQARWLRARVGPTRATTAAADRYLARHGLSVSGEGILTRTYAGSVAAASQAFRTPVLLYRQDGALFRAPALRPSLPGGLARRVSSIDGLSSRAIAHPLAGSATAAATLKSCAGASQLQALGRGYQPAQFASPDAYDFQSLLDAGHAGQADTLALMEFSNYTPSNVAAYQACYGTTVPITDVPVNGGTTDRGGAGEVQLDEEVAATAAPGLSHIYTYIAPNDGSTSWGSLIDSIIEDQPTTHTNVVSISWGDCEYPALFPSMRSDDTEFQLAKAAGLTVVAASGDTGSDDCGPGSHTYRVDYPSSSPYVTGVGGTSLHLGTTGSSHETTWGHPDSDSGTGGGGGASILYPMPSWQTAPGVISTDTHSTCGAANDQPCREVPDVSFDANPKTGYIIYSGGKWRLFGGTSAGAPLLAAIIADADTYSIAHGGRRMGGSANPFFYAHAGAPLFRDITVGSNNIYGLPDLYPATAGYDMATGLGAPAGRSWHSCCSPTPRAPPPIRRRSDRDGVGDDDHARRRHHVPRHVD